MDPPYETQIVAPALNALVACGTLAKGALIVMEHSIREPLASPMQGLRVADQRRFGKTLVSFMDNML
jgi:16S rRNA (guanine966-N2)-methyltransferase